MRGFSVDTGGDGVSFSLYADIKEGELSLLFFFMCELYGGVDAVEVVVEGFELFLSVWPYHESVPDPHAGA